MFLSFALPVNLFMSAPRLTFCLHIVPSSTNVQREMVTRGSRIRDGSSDIDMCVDAVQEINQSPAFDELEASIQNCFKILHSEANLDPGRRTPSPSVTTQHQHQPRLDHEQHP